MTDLRSGAACSMLLRASRTSRVPELQWPFCKDRLSVGEKKLEGEKRKEELENRDAEGGELEKRDEEGDGGMTVEEGRRPAETCEARLFDIDDVEEEQEEVEDDGLAFCVGIWGDGGKKRSKRSWALLGNRLWFSCCCVAWRCCCCGSKIGCCICAVCWAFCVFAEIREFRLKSSPNAGACPTRLSIPSPPSVLSGEGDGELAVRSKISFEGILEDKFEDCAVGWRDEFCCWETLRIKGWG